MVNSRKDKQSSTENRFWDGGNRMRKEGDVHGTAGRGCSTWGERLASTLAAGMKQDRHGVLKESLGHLIRSSAVPLPISNVIPHYHPLSWKSLDGTEHFNHRVYRDNPVSPRFTDRERPLTRMAIRVSVTRCVELAATEQLIWASSL